MRTWILDYDGALSLKYTPPDSLSFKSTAFYKLYLRRYVRECYDGLVRFKPALNYRDYEKVINLCEKEAIHNNIDFSVGEELKDYIDQRNIYIESRSRLGIEIKNHEGKLDEKFLEYKQIVDRQMARQLRDQQMRDSFFMCAMQRSADFSVPGSGKTASVLGVYAYLHYKKLANKIVVICPKNAFGSWIDEFHACFDGLDTLNVFNVHDDKFKNREQRRKALLYYSGKCNLFLINYESVEGIYEELKEIIDNHTLLVYDEVHRIKRIDGRRAQYSLAIAKNASYTVVMTGTPLPNGYSDIYNFLHILFPDEYNDFFGFSQGMLNDPSQSDIDHINNKLQPFFCRTTKDQLGVPKANPDEIIAVEATPDEDRIAEILKMKYRRNKLALFIRLLQAESNPKMLLERLDLSQFQYLIDDSVEDVDQIDVADYSDEIKELINRNEITSKYKKCIDLIQKLVSEGKTVIVWCIFINSIRRITRDLEKAGIISKAVYGEVELDERQKIINDFKNGEIHVMVTNPHTLAESVSLHTVCHDAVYFEYSYNLVHLLQSKDRINRLGLPANQYTQYYFIRSDYSGAQGEWSIDEEVYNRLKDKEEIMLNAIDRNVLETMPTSMEDLDLIFSKLKF